MTPVSPLRQPNWRMALKKKKANNGRRKSLDELRRIDDVTSKMQFAIRIAHEAISSQTELKLKSCIILMLKYRKPFPLTGSIFPLNQNGRCLMIEVHVQSRATPDIFQLNSKAVIYFTNQ